MDITHIFKDLLQQKKVSLSPKNKPKPRNNNKSIFMDSALEMKNNIEILSHQVVTFSKYYLQNSTLFTNQSLNNYQLSQQFDIQSKLKQETENLTQLQSLLDELEQDRRKLSLTPHQLAFYQSIITLMFSNLSEISKQIQKIKHRNITDSKFSKRIFETTTPTVSQDLIESLKDKDEIVDSSFQDTLYLENQTIYSEMNEYLEDVEKIEKSAVEISTLLATFEEKLSEDSFKIEKLYNTTESALEYAKQAKDELQATGDRGQSIFQKLTIWILVFAALWILILDFVN